MEAEVLFSLDKKSLETIYFSFICHLWEYVDTVGNNCRQFEANDTEKENNTNTDSSRRHQTCFN